MRLCRWLQKRAGAPAPRSCWSAGPTSASPRSSTASPNSRRSIVTPIAGTTRDVISLPAEWQGVHVYARGHRRDVRRAARIRCTSWSSIQGQKALTQRGRDRVRRGRPRGSGLRRTRRLRRACAAPSVPVLLAVNKTDDERARGPRGGVLPARIRAGRRDRGRARRRGRRPARRDPRAASGRAVATARPP